MIYVYFSFADGDYYSFYNKALIENYILYSGNRKGVV